MKRSGEAGEREPGRTMGIRNVGAPVAPKCAPTTPTMFFSPAQSSHTV
jgi:hypothetical protein